MSDQPLGTPPPPDEGRSGYPPPSPPGWQAPPLPPPPAGEYLQHGYGYVPGQQAEYAGFWIRFGASLIDRIIIGIPITLVAVALFGSDSVGFRIGSYNPAVDVGVNLMTTAVEAIYFSMLEGGSTGQTLGKKICGIRVVDKPTLQPGIGVGRGVGRYFARILSSLPLLLGYFWMLWDRDKQTWHDKLTNVVVVKVQGV